MISRPVFNRWVLSFDGKHALEPINWFQGFKVTLITIWLYYFMYGYWETFSSEFAKTSSNCCGTLNITDWVSMHILCKRELEAGFFYFDSNSSDTHKISNCVSNIKQLRAIIILKIVIREIAANKIWLAYTQRQKPKFLSRILKIYRFQPNCYCYVIQDIILKVWQNLILESRILEHSEINFCKGFSFSKMGFVLVWFTTYISISYWYTMPISAVLLNLFNEIFAFQISIWHN